LVSRASENGMTLLELLVVLAVLSLIAGAVSPYIGRSQSRMALRTAEHDVAAALREARGAAVMRNRTEFFTGDTASGVFGVAGSPRQKSLPRGVGMTLYTTMDQRTDAEAGSITFWPDGSSTGGGVKLAQEDRVVLVQVDWLTGKVSTHDASPSPDNRPR
jgi:general secretion pathway protein H